MPQRPPKISASKRLRRCIVSGALRPQEALIRFARGPQAEGVADQRERLPGR